MSLVEHLMQRDRLDLAKELARTAKEKADLQRRVVELEMQNFWLSVPSAQARLQQAMDIIDAARLRHLERLQADQQHRGVEHRAVNP